MQQIEFGGLPIIHDFFFPFFYISFFRCRKIPKNACSSTCKPTDDIVLLTEHFYTKLFDMVKKSSIAGIIIWRSWILSRTSFEDALCIDLVGKKSKPIYLFFHPPFGI